MRSAKGVVLALVAVLALAATVGVASGAHKAKSDSKVEIDKASGDESGVDVRGTVSSQRARCEKNRTVAVYHDTPPPGPDSRDFKLGETTTNDKGKWRLSSTELPDKVYAVVKGNRRCKADTSKTEGVEYRLPH